MGETCQFNRAYIGKCGAPASKASGLCGTHKGMKCVSCGGQATQECDYTGQFVCGYPLCGDCEWYNNPDTPSGAWGFLGHKHRSKAVHRRVMTDGAMSDDLEPDNGR